MRFDRSRLDDGANAYGCAAVTAEMAAASIMPMDIDEDSMLRLVAVAIAIPTIFAAWAGSRVAVSAQKPVDRVTFAGCVARQTGAGAANTAATPGTAAGPLLLTRIAEVADQQSRGAVPATPPTGDTGTLGARASQPAPPSSVERSFELIGPSAAGLGEHVGKRVAITGTLVESKPATADTAHPSSPRGRLTVVSFRPLGGSCPLS